VCVCVGGGGGRAGAGQAGALVGFYCTGKQLTAGNSILKASLASSCSSLHCCWRLAMKGCRCIHQCTPDMQLLLLAKSSSMLQEWVC
jgi:hypothetical protein